MKISRTIATRIMSQANQRDDDCLLAIINVKQRLFFANTFTDMEELIKSHPNAVLIYNQNQQAINFITKIQKYSGQKLIEIFQDTEGVFGLKAYELINNELQSITLEL